MKNCWIKPFVIIVFILVCGCFNLFAENYVGLGFSGVTLGRNIPALHLALSSDSLRFSLITTGVKTPVYYHNAYQAALFSTWKAGDLFWGELEAGFGGGFLYFGGGWFVGGGGGA